MKFNKCQVGKSEYVPLSLHTAHHGVMPQCLLSANMLFHSLQVRCVYFLEDETIRLTHRLAWSGLSTLVGSRGGFFDTLGKRLGLSSVNYNVCFSVGDASLCEKIFLGSFKYLAGLVCTQHRVLVCLMCIGSLIKFTEVDGAI